MKIQSISQWIHSSSKIREKEGGQQVDPDAQRQRRQSDQDQSKPEEEQVEATPEAIHQAVDDFRAEMQNRPYPLSPAVEGEGFGLKVVLKDGAGSVIWQMSGEEFVRLRRAAPKGQVRGKILDRKF